MISWRYRPISKDFDYLYMVLLIGTKGVGTNTLRKNWLNDGGFSDLNYKLTIGVNFAGKTLELPNGNVVKLLIYDINLSKHWSRIRELMYKPTFGAIILYDLTNKDSLANLEIWCQEIRESTGDIPILLVGNKCDLPEEQEVSAEYVLQLKEKYHLSGTMEISAKTGEDVEKMFMELTKLISTSKNIEFEKKKK